MSLARTPSPTATRGLFWDSLIQSGFWLFFAACLVLSYWRPGPVRAHLSTLVVFAVVMVLILPVWQFFSARHFTVENGRRWQLWIIAADIGLILASIGLPQGWHFWTGYGLPLLFVFSLLHTAGCWIDYLRHAADLPHRHSELLDIE